MADVGDGGDGIRPSDIVSHCSETSSVRSAAERQRLMIQAKFAKRRNELELERLRVEGELQQLQLEALIEAAEVADAPTSTRGQADTSSRLNPMAAEWPVPASSADNPLPATVGEKPGLSDLVATLKLPQAQIPKFDGDPMKYWLFVRTFDDCVGSAEVDAAAKLNRLIQYCTGKALRLIQCCAVMAPDAGYRKARQLLKERFGNDYLIAECWVQKLVDGPVLNARDKTSLQELADDVRACKETLEAIGMLSEIDTRTRMVKIVSRLPPYLQSKWRHLAVKQLESSKRYPDLKKLVEFIESAARELNDPVFGYRDCGAAVTEQRSKPQSKKNSGSSFTVNATGRINKPVRERYASQPMQVRPRLSCYLCAGEHRLSECVEFDRMSPERRFQTVRERDLFQLYNCKPRCKNLQKTRLQCSWLWPETFVGAARGLCDSVSAGRYCYSTRTSGR